MKSLYSFLIVCMFFITGCDVDRPLEDAISDQSFWKNETDLKSATNYLYTFLPGLPLSDDNWSDDGFAIQPNEISSGARTPPAVDNYYNDPYIVIRAANNILDKAKISVAAGVPQTTVDIYIGEALFFRAWSYFNLVQKYGDVPLILSLISETSPELKSPKTPREEVLNAIYKDLDEAYAKLPTPTARGNAGFGRITNTAAMSLKARAGLFEGTRSKFHQYGDANKHLSIAVEAANLVIMSGEHSLFGNYFDLFQYEGEGRQNRENILVKQHGINVNQDIVSFNGGSITNGVNNITKSLVDAYLMEDGLPIDKSALYVTPEDHAGYFANRDLRMGQTVFKKHDPYYQDVLFTFPALTYHTTGFPVRKFVDPKDIGIATNRSFIDRPIIRYAEVLLTYAEAKYELNGSISDEDLNMTINLLRARAGIPLLTNGFVALHGLNMREEIRRERRVELAVEGFRYWDIIRWKTAEVVLPEQVLGSYFFESDFPIGEPNLTPDNHILVQSKSTRAFRVDRDYLWPFPVNELALNPALEQNPKW